MTIIPYVEPGCLKSDSVYHYHTFREAILSVYDETYPHEYNTKVTKRFRIIDTEEDFEVTYVAGNVNDEFEPEIKFYIG